MSNLMSKNFNRRKFIKIIGLSAFGSTSYGLYNYLNDKQTVKTEWKGSVLNNQASLEIHSNSRKNNHNILKEVNTFVNNADQIFNLQNEKSEIVLLNKNKSLINPSTSLIEVIKKSQIISEKTDGIFDITVQPLWNYYYNHFILEGNKYFPDEKKLKSITKPINWKNVIIDNNNILLKNNASITLNGIAQGWITDQITSILKKNNITNTLVDFGETYALGNYEDIRSWNILLQGANNINKVIKLSNKAVATSSGGGTMFEPTNKYNHIFNPRTGLSENKYNTVSVVSDKAWLSDSLATSAIMLNKQKLKLISANFNAQVYILENNKFQEII